MFKKLASLLLIAFTMVGCSNTLAKDVDGEVSEIRFKDMTYVSELEKLDGEEVTITGFMAQSSPLDGSIIYLMNMPYQSCVFCVPNTNQLMNTLAVYPKKAGSMEFTDLPVKVTGKLVFEDTTDEMGYSYSYKLINAKATLADVEYLEDTVRIYTQLVNQGFTTEFMNALLEIYNAVNYSESGESLDNLGILEGESLNNIDKMFSNLNSSDYEDILSTIEKVQELKNTVNEAIKNKSDENFADYSSEIDVLFNEFYDWILKPEL